METKCPETVDKKTLVSDKLVKDVTPLTQEQIDDLLTEIASEN